MPLRSRRWVFTLNNYTDNDCERLAALAPPAIRYIVFGREVGENGTPHLQGYVEFINARNLAGVRELISDRAHFETARGNPAQASEYCKKDGQFTEIGEISRQGARTDLEECAELVRLGGANEVAENMPEMILKYGNNIERLAVFYQKHRTEAPRVVWLWGLAGVGKTRAATTGCESYYIWSGGKFWCGYNQQQRVVIDDFTYDRIEDRGQYHFRYLLRLFDLYEISVEIKGGHVKFNSPEIFITCEYPPSHFWEGNTLAQVERRLAEIRQIHAEEPKEIAQPPIRGSLVFRNMDDNVGPHKSEPWADSIGLYGPWDDDSDDEDDISDGEILALFEE